MENHANQEDFTSLIPEDKSAYLLDPEFQYEGICSERRAQEDAHAQWIARKRLKAQISASTNDVGGLPRIEILNLEESTDDDDMYERPSTSWNAVHM